MPWPAVSQSTFCSWKTMLGKPSSPSVLSYEPDTRWRWWAMEPLGWSSQRQGPMGGGGPSGEAVVRDVLRMLIDYLQAIQP